jgi:hypothetical protein
MSKLAPNPVPPQGLTQRPHSGRSYWVRNIAGAADANANAQSHSGLCSPEPPGAHSTPPTPNTGMPKASGKKRFVEPYRLSDEQRDAMLAPLAERGLGDAESRDLFAAALAYDIATCYELTTAEPMPEPESPPAVAQAAAQVEARPPRSKGRAPVAEPAAVPAVSPALVELAEAARTLSRCLQALDAGVKTSLFKTLRDADRFQRGYDDAYLIALTGELTRLVEGAAPQPLAVATIETSTEAPVALAPVPAPRKVTAPKPSPAARQFIIRAADAFEECFDQAPTAQVGGPFTAMLKALAMATGIRIPTDARNLAEILRRA